MTHIKQYIDEDYWYQKPVSSKLKNNKTFLAKFIQKQESVLIRVSDFPKCPMYVCVSTP